MLLEEGKLLSEVSTFKIGGPAKFFTQVRSSQEMKEALTFANSHHLPFLILGKGSNVLFDDRGFNGFVILNRIDFCEWREEKVRVGAGYSFSLLGVQSARVGLSGLEFASGIPGSVGGAVFMNAGANQSQTADCLTSVEYVKDSGEEMLFTREKLSFQYRYSPFQEMKGAITAATFTLTFLENAKIKQLKIIEHRKKTQPLTEKSAGCIFRNPSHSSAGFLIEKVGLKGKKIGGALISPIHANFIINAGGAKAHDVLSLIQEISEKVKSETGIDLELEVRYIPYI